jgi:TM2 domain-containing membrane protein YozV
MLICPVESMDGEPGNEQAGIHVTFSDENAPDTKSGQEATMTIAPVMTVNMTREQREVFYTQMSLVQKDEMLGVLLALFLGTFGAHRFYLHENGCGALYVLFFWTGIPTLISLVEAFFMPGRVRRFNAAYAAWIAAHLQGTAPALATSTGWTTDCARCGGAIVPGSNFCSHCGVAVRA